MVKQTEAGVLGWEFIEEDEIVVPEPTRTLRALVDTAGKIIIIGFLIARGPDSHFVVRPQWGDMDYVRGKPARGGRVKDSHCRRRQVQLPWERRLKIADELLRYTEPHSEPKPGVLCFRKCQHGRYWVYPVSFRRRLRIEQGEEIFYPKPDLNAGVRSFLEAGDLICVEQH